MKQSLKMSLSSLNIFNSISKILNSIIKTHKPSMNQSSIKIIQSICRFKCNSFFKLSQCIINLIQHHHTVSSICIILRLFIIKSDSSTKIIHSFLIVPSCHESITSVSMILCMSGAFIVSSCTLQTGYGFTKFLYG